MQCSILWQGRQADSKEHCLIHTNESGIKVDSVIIGKQGDMIYRVEYAILLNLQWETLSFSISSLHNDVIQRLDYASDGKGNWTDQGEPVPKLDGCLYIDLPLTPFTNSLPINRLHLQNGEEQQIRVIYIDLLEEKVSPLSQKYKKLGDNSYHYQNVPNDFEAVITTNEDGLVTDYPGLFIQTGLRKI